MRIQKRRDDPEEWRIAVVLEGYESVFKSVGWSEGDNFLASCSRDNSILVWEETGDDFETATAMSEHDEDVKCVAWHPKKNFKPARPMAMMSGYGGRMMIGAVWKY